MGKVRLRSKSKRSPPYPSPMDPREPAVGWAPDQQEEAVLAWELQRVGGEVCLGEFEALWESHGRKGPHPALIVALILRGKITSRLKQGKGKRFQAIRLVRPRRDGLYQFTIDIKSSPGKAAGELRRFLENQRALDGWLHSRQRSAIRHPGRHPSMEADILVDALIVICLKAGLPPDEMLKELRARHKVDWGGENESLLKERLRQRIRLLKRRYRDRPEFLRASTGPEFIFNVDGHAFDR